jgi:hypothetical protein
MVTIRRSFPVLVLGLLAAALVALSVVPSAPAGQKPCWQRLIDDWYDGRIDGRYPVRCYREALRHVPEDAAVYSSLPEDLERALQSALGGSGGGPPDPGTLVAPGPGRELTGSNNGDSGPASTMPPPIDRGDDKGVLENFSPSNADSIPIPLLVLAALAMLLLAAAAASFVARRLQARRAPATPRPRPRAPGS